MSQFKLALLFCITFMLYLPLNSTNLQSNFDFGKGILENINEKIGPITQVAYSQLGNLDNSETVIAKAIHANNPFKNSFRKSRKNPKNYATVSSSSIYGPKGSLKSQTYSKSYLSSASNVDIE